MKTNQEHGNEYGMPRSTVIRWQEPAIERAARKALSKPSGDLTQEEVSGIRELSVTDEGLTSLSDLRSFTGLTELLLWDNQIRDLSPLSGLTGLTKLSLNFNEISDLSPLIGLTGLTDLYLSSNQIRDLSPLSGLTGLMGLNLSFNEIRDLSPLSGLTGLNRLDLDRNEIRDLSPLSGLTGLTRLGLNGNRIADFSPLADLPLDMKKVRREDQKPEPEPLCSGLAEKMTGDPAQENTAAPASDLQDKGADEKFRQACRLLKQGGEQNVKDALFYCTVLAMEGCPSACGVLGSCYEDGLNTVVDLRTALYWYQQAADRGSALGTMRLARCLVHGIGTEKDPEKALPLFRRAADLGVSEAFLYLGWAYLYGEGVEQDCRLARKNFFHEGIRLCRQAVKEGSTSAMIALSACYENDLGVPRSWAGTDDERQYQAALLLYQAAQLGDPRGWRQLNSWYIPAFFEYRDAADKMNALLEADGVLAPGSSMLTRMQRFEELQSRLDDADKRLRASEFLRDL